MADEWFQYSSADHFWMDWRFKVISKNFESILKQEKSFIEVGCGNCCFLKQFEQQYGKSMDGLDLNLKALELAEDVQGTLYVYDVLDNHGELDNRYDVAFLLDVLEHINQPTEFLSSVSNLLTSSGFCLVNVPQSQRLYSVYDEVAGHVCRYSHSNLRKIAEDAGFSVLKSLSWGVSMIPLLYLRKHFSSRIPRDQVIQMGFSPPHHLIHSLLRLVGTMERICLPSLSYGTSITALLQKR